MKKMLKRKDVTLYHYINGVRVAGAHKELHDDGRLEITGDCSNIYGYPQSLIGDCSNLRGNVTGIIGHCSHVSGDLDACEITDAQRRMIIVIETLLMG